MKASELRIGNYISDIHTPTGMWKIKSIGECIVKYGNYAANTYKSRYEHLLPIPLSPEILEKAGFEKIKHIHGYEFWTNKKKRGEYYIPSIDIYEYKTEFQSNSVPHCKYLHELQNLYRWTTGQELTINL